MNQFDNNESEADIAATVADVFGIDLGTDTTNKEPEAPGAPAQQPSVGTEGAGGEGAPPAPASPATPAPAEAPGGTGSAVEVQPKPGTPAEGQQPPTPPTPQPEAGDPLQLKIASLEARLAAAEAANPMEAAPSISGQPAKEFDPKAPISVQLPQALTEQIFNEDPAVAAQGMNTLVSTIATGLAQRFEMRLEQVVGPIATYLNTQRTETSNAAQEETSAKAREDYFKAFPGHNKPVLLPIVAQEAQQLAAEFPGVAWDENFQNTLGARVNQKLQEAGVAVGIEPPAAAPAAPTPKPAPFLNQGTRPAPEEDADIIMETFSI